MRRVQTKELLGRVSSIVIFGLSIALTGCGAGNSEIFNSSSGGALNFTPGSPPTKNAASEQVAALDSDVECPGVTIRSGASTLMISKTQNNAEPTPTDVRYQGSILRTARECHINSGVMTMKIGIEGRVITGPAGGPGTVDVPLRVAVVEEGVEPKTVASKLGHETVTVANENDRVGFTHIDSDISFPLPQPISNIDKYVVYVGFDPLGAQNEKKKPAKRGYATAKPKPR